jgi:hypothetical protein
MVTTIPERTEIAVEGYPFRHYQGADMIRDPERTEIAEAICFRHYQGSRGS